MPLTALVPFTSTLRSGEMSLTDYLDELEAHVAGREPDVLSLVPEKGRFERLRDDAGALLDRYPDPESRPPLFGVPIGVKDIFHAEGFQTKAGSTLPPEILAGPEARSVTQLKGAGALILGKTVTTEFAYFAPGPTRNPHNPEHTPGGSSSGSAAAVGAGISPLTLGTQTIGSINRPAGFCGVVGYKPSYERISREGVIPLSQSADHVGFFASDMAGANLVASLIVSGWQPYSNDRRPVLGVPEGPYLGRASGEGLAHFGNARAQLATAGYEVKSVSAMPDYDAIFERHNQLVAAETAQVHADWYAEFKDRYHPKTAELIERGQGVTPAELEEARAGCEKLRRELAALMDEHGLDLWLAPAAPGPAPKGLDSTGDPVMNLPWTHAGVPSLTVPAGVNGAGLPMGVQLVGRFNRDEATLYWAQEIEDALKS